MAVRVLLPALLLAFCGCADPYGAADRPAPVGPGTRAGVGDARPRQAPTDVTPQAPVGRRDERPAALVRRYAELAGNWGWRTYAAALQRQARLSVGELATQQRQAAVESAQDESLRRDRPASQATVVSVSAVDRHRGRFVVVTRELASSAGTVALEGERYRVTLATVVHEHGAWRMAAWEPQP